MSDLDDEELEATRRLNGADKIEVGEYVRTPNQGIFYISHINIDFDDSNFNKVVMCQNEYVSFTNIDTVKTLKHSKNIIDLIQENDLLKIEYEISDHKKQTEVVEVIRNYQGLLYVNTFVGKFFVRDLEHYDRKLLSIATKEQFKSIEYRLED